MRNDQMSMKFGPRVSVEQVEEGTELAPKFDDQGLIPAVTTDFDSGELLMHGYMNAEALERTIRTGEAHYFSRSRQALWHKGATSGLVQRVKELMVDDDQDCVWLRVEVVGGASCHVGYRSCFYRAIPKNTINDFIVALRDQGFRVTDFEGYLFEGRFVYACQWVKLAANEEAEFYNRNATHTRNGFRLTEFEVYEDKGTVYYAGSWLKSHAKPVQPVAEPDAPAKRMSLEAFRSEGE